MFFCKNQSISPNINFQGKPQFNFYVAEAIVCRCSLKLVFQKIRKFYKKTPVLESLFNKKSLKLKHFPLKIDKFFITPFFKERLWWLLMMLFVVSINLLALEIMVIHNKHFHRIKSNLE